MHQAAPSLASYPSLPAARKLLPPTEQCTDKEIDDPSHQKITTMRVVLEKKLVLTQTNNHILVNN